jgi:hypothetical protein
MDLIRKDLITKDLMTKDLMTKDLAAARRLPLAKALVPA